jgi:hypothetical protein
MAGTTGVPTLVYYRFQHEPPRAGEEVHCFTDF